MEHPMRGLLQAQLQLQAAADEAVTMLARGRASAEHLEALVKDVTPPVPALVAHIRESLDRALGLLKPAAEVCRKEGEARRAALAAAAAAAAAAPSATAAAKAVPSPAAQVQPLTIVPPSQQQQPPPPEAPPAAAASQTQTQPQLQHHQKRRRCDLSSQKRVVVRKKTMEDGFIWRKYGEKNILNAKYPRWYFRCTHKYERGCEATKQVQQSEDTPSHLVITYIGEHTCVEPAPVKDSSSFIISFDSKTARVDEGSTPKYYPPPWSAREESSCDNKDTVTEDRRPPARTLLTPKVEEVPRVYDIVDVDDGSESSGDSTRTESQNERQLDLNLNL